MRPFRPGPAARSTWAALARIAPRAWLRRHRGVLLAFAYPAVGAALLGSPAGLVWAAVAPRPELVLTPIGATYANPQPEAVIAADGWFTVVSAAAGVLCGLATYVLGHRWLRARAREVAVLLGVAGGGLLGSVIAARVGRLTELASFQQQAGTLPPGVRVFGFLQLHATGLLMTWPLVAVLTLTAAFAIGDAREGRRWPSH